MPDKRSADHSVQREQDYDDEHIVVANKRQRTALACDTCRNRKSRCDGVRPACTACAEMGFVCTYRRPAATVTHPDPSRFSQIERRLAMMEDMLQSLSRPCGGGQVPDERTPSELPVSSGAGEDSVDGLGTMTFAGEAVSQFFGPSSNSAFAALIMRVTITRQRAPGVVAGKAPPMISRPSSPPPRGSLEGTATSNLYFVPSRNEVVQLADRFFTLTGGFFPYIDRTSFMDTIREGELYSSATTRRSWLSLLNAILACGMSAGLFESQDVRADEEQSHVYFQRALELSPWTTSSIANLETVQALAVMTQYLQGTSRSAPTWRLHGHLVQAAFQMGLHFEDSMLEMTPLEREIRRRTWYMIFNIDRCDDSFPPGLENILT